MGDQKVITEVPAALKRLAKYVVRGFYEVEHSLALDLLIRYPCVKEDDLLALLKFEKKQLRAILTSLKLDKIIKSRMRVETGEDGKATRHNYYYINYKLLVDVTKYKLDQVRKKIETDERDSTTRASFKCPVCGSLYSDLEVNHLFDPASGEFHCTYCSAEVEEDASALPKRDARTLLARFNEQIEPIYHLLRETEDVVLSCELLEPEPTEIPELMPSFDQMSSGNMKDRSERWSRSTSSFNMYVQDLVVNLQDSNSNTVKSANTSAKECPIWMTQSTVLGASVQPSESNRADNVAETCDLNPNTKEPIDDEVIRTLLIHEKKSSAKESTTHSSAHQKESSGSDTSESDEDSKATKSQLVKPPGTPSKQKDAEEDEGDDDPVVMIGGRPHMYSEVSEHPELVSFMTGEEREAYIQIGKVMFHAMYD
ncbi:general transcription factor IIE subunit 1-like [Acipenser oxyrinchus oxyrinchus]|uniref:General transcription factor IIE subunit 1 n=1 Tax=Acipenser oxyrinchus oxyrinchus TaxID=40147 RepID=A0AAD8GIN3_ACIOX|nr:general transcription factor IIE subunit 1-like [Acipenser oxyrinchus oxyrinchus]